MKDYTTRSGNNKCSAECWGKLAEILEKVLKAELIRSGWFLEKTHDLERLRKELRTRDAELAGELQRCVVARRRRSGPGSAGLECLEGMETNAPACFHRLRWP